MVQLMRICGRILPGIDFNMKNQKAFTLIELLLYVGIVSIVMSTLIAFAWNVVISGVKNTTQQEVYSQSRYLAEKIKYEIRNASTINTGTSNFGVELANNSSSQLSLGNSVVSNNPTIINVSGGKVMIKQGSSTAIALNSADTTVTSLIFTNYSSVDNKTKHIGFTLTVRSNTTNTRKEYINSMTLRSSAELRSN